MNILCIICSEFLTNEEDIVISTCGHCFHRQCINDWIKNARTCPTCRQLLPQSSLIKVFFENDNHRFQDLHNELLKTNEKLTKELEDIKEKSRLQENELIETNAKFRESSDKLKKLERDRQLDEMALAGLRMIKEESAKEILKLNTQVGTLKLDMLAEKQLRRIHQTTLHKLDPQNENYDIKSITVEEHPIESLSPNYTITPFWQLNAEATKTETVKKDHSYIIPSKIQKSNDNKMSSSSQTRYPLFTKKRSSSRDENQDMPSSSGQTSIRFSFAENSNPQTSTVSTNTTTTENANSKGPFKFNFGNSAGFSSLFRFGNELSSQEPSTSQQSNQQPSTSTAPKPLHSYRDNRKDFGNPRTSER